MIAAIVIWIALMWSIIDGVLWARMMRRIRRAREAWPPGRVVDTRATIGETF